MSKSANRGLPLMVTDRIRLNRDVARRGETE